MKVIRILGYTAVALLLAVQVDAACHTEVHPENVEGRVGFPMFMMPPGRSTVLRFTPPANATSVGLEFWSHFLPVEPTAPAGSLTMNWYQFVDGKRKVTGTAQNLQAGWENFSMSTFVHTNEAFAVSVHNANDYPVPYFLAVTIRVCVP